MATKDNLAAFEARRAELEAKLADVKAAAEARAVALSALTNVTIATKAGDEGKLFGSVGTVISLMRSLLPVLLLQSEVRMPDGVLRSVGEYDIVVHLHTDVNTTVKVAVAE